MAKRSEAKQVEANGGTGDEIASLRAEIERLRGSIMSISRRVGRLELAAVGVAVDREEKRSGKRAK